MLKLKLRSPKACRVGGPGTVTDYHVKRHRLSCEARLDKGACEAPALQTIVMEAVVDDFF